MKGLKLKEEVLKYCENKEYIYLYDGIIKTLEELEEGKNTALIGPRMTCKTLFGILISICILKNTNKGNIILTGKTRDDSIKLKYLLEKLWVDIFNENIPAYQSDRIILRSALSKSLVVGELKNTIFILYDGLYNKQHKVALYNRPLTLITDITLEGFEGRKNLDTFSIITMEYGKEKLLDQERFDKQCKVLEMNLEFINKELLIGRENTLVKIGG